MAFAFRIDYAGLLVSNGLALVRAAQAMRSLHSELDQLQTRQHGLMADYLGYLSAAPLPVYQPLKPSLLKNSDAVSAAIEEMSFWRHYLFVFCFVATAVALSVRVVYLGVTERDFLQEEGQTLYL